MDPVSLLLASTLSSSVVDLLRRVRLEEGDSRDAFRVRKSGESDTAAALEALPASTREVLESVAAGTADSQDDAGASGSKGRDRTVDPQQAAAALTLAPQLFADARRRISLMFRLRLGLALILAVVLIGAIGVAIFAAFQGNNGLALIFGGLSLIDILAFAFGKPLKAVTDVVVASQRLELLHLRVQVDIKSCAQLSQPEARIQCQMDVWTAIQAELAAMGGD